MPAPDEPLTGDFSRRRLESLLAQNQAAVQQMHHLVERGCKRKKLFGLIADVVGWGALPRPRVTRAEVAAARAEALAVEIARCETDGTAPSESYRLVALLHRWAEASRHQTSLKVDDRQLSPHLQRLAVQRLVRYVSARTGRGRYRRVAILLSVATGSGWTAEQVKEEAGRQP